MGKLAQAIVHGAKAAAGRRQLRRLPAIWPASWPQTTRSPWSTRSTRTASRARRPAAFEIVDVLGDAPDVHCLPVGNAGNITAYWAGFTRVPRRRTLARSCPGCSASRRPARRRSCSASRSRTPDHRHRDPHRQPGVLDAGARGRPDESGGAYRAVTDGEILAAYRCSRAGGGIRRAGVGGRRSPASSSAACRTGCPSRLARGLHLTGNGLKDPDWALSGAPSPGTIPADPTAAATALGLA